MKAQREKQKYSSTLSLTSVLDGGGWSTPRPSRYTLGKESRYLFYRRLGGHHGRSGRVQENLAPTGIRSPDLSVCSELYCYDLCVMGVVPTTLFFWFGVQFRVCPWKHCSQCGWLYNSPFSKHSSFVRQVFLASTTRGSPLAAKGGTMGKKWWPNGAWVMHPGFFYMPQICDMGLNLGTKGQHATSAPPKPLPTADRQCVWRWQIWFLLRGVLYVVSCKSLNIMLVLGSSLLK